MRVQVLTIFPELFGPFLDLDPEAPGTSTVDLGTDVTLELVASTSIYHDYLLA